MSRGNVYLLAPDLHWNEKNLRGRKSYSDETKHSLEFLISVILKYKSLNYNVKLIFMGDIFHISYNTVFGGIRANNLIIKLRGLVDGMYCVLGNHEFSYYKDNPFWTLLTEVKSERVLNLSSKISQPVGEIHVIDVVDELVDGDTRFIFNHFGCGIHRPVVDGKKNIGLFHQDLYAKDIAKNMEALLGENIYEHTPVYFDNTGKLYGYDYAYIAHMHMFYGIWDYVCEVTGQETRLSYLSTVGRTNHREVNDNFLERDVPAIIVEDGKFVKAESNLFNLLSRSDCIIEEEILVAQQNREELKSRKDFARNYVAVADNPIENMRIALASKPLMLSIFNQTLESGTNEIHERFTTELEAYLCLK